MTRGKRRVNPVGYESEVMIYAALIYRMIDS